MSAGENFLKYFLEKRKNMKHFKIKIQLFQSVLEILNYQFSKNLIF